MLNGLRKLLSAAKSGKLFHALTIRSRSKRNHSEVVINLIDYWSFDWLIDWLICLFVSLFIKLIGQTSLIHHIFSRSIYGCGITVGNFSMPCISNAPRRRALPIRCYRIAFRFFCETYRGAEWATLSCQLIASMLRGWIDGLEKPTWSDTVFADQTIRKRKTMKPTSDDSSSPPSQKIIK